MAQSQSGYSRGQMMEMSRDAMRRVNEMQRIAREKIAQTTAEYQTESPQENFDNINSNGENNENNPKAGIHNNSNSSTHGENYYEAPKHQEHNKPTEHIKTEVVDKGLKGILDRLELDNEKIMLIVLIFLLINEGADPLLILALGYILL